MLNSGEESHHSTPRVTQMRMSCGRLAENNENLKVFAGHFKKALNSNQLNHDAALSDIMRKEVMVELDAPPKWTEFKKAVMELTNNKVPCLNGISPNVFKAMPNQNLLHNFNLITELWEGEIDVEE